RGTAAANSRRLLSQYGSQIVVGLPVLRIHAEDGFECLNRGLQITLLLERESELLAHVDAIRTACEYGLEFFQSSIRIAFSAQGDSQVHAQLGIRLVQGDGLPERNYRLFHVARLRQRRPQIVPCADEVRLRLNR